MNTKQIIESVVNFASGCTNTRTTRSIAFVVAALISRMINAFMIVQVVSLCESPFTGEVAASDIAWEVSTTTLGMLGTLVVFEVARL